ncbi:MULTISPECIES: hypothetical protein [unclassified Xanthobacter]|uniref:hypothetical protein n=1 Tax=unclassified Xanthobacter TaxID=2623496 RepID=UPI001EDE12BE|nr:MULTISPECIES: hypothetical protein [unclassified Xanthobacter]
MTYFAHTDRAGAIAVSHRVPTSRLIIVDEPDEALLRRVIGAAADRDGETLFVPHLAQADDREALGILMRFRRTVARALAAAS